MKKQSRKSEIPVVNVPIYKGGEPGATTPERENERALVRVSNGDIVEVHIIDRTLDKKFALVQYDNMRAEWKETDTLEIVHTFPKKQGIKVSK